MLTSRYSVSDSVTRIAELSDEFMVRRVDDHWLVAGPTGLFVIGRVGSDVYADAHSAVHLSQQLRESLSLAMAWVPFVDVLLVGAHSTSDLGCSIVRPSMLESVLLDGHRRLDASTLCDVRRHLPRLAIELSTSIVEKVPNLA